MKQITNLQHQQGIGLVEVMVALLLLAVAILGFSSMQIVAVKSTDESMMRTRAMTVIRSGSEMMRANPEGIAGFEAALGGNGNSFESINASSCVTKSTGSVQNCNARQLGIRDAMVVKQHASSNDLRVRLVNCPGTENLALRKKCFITSWGDTQPNLGNNSNDCAKNTGIYNRGAQCFIMEAY